MRLDHTFWLTSSLWKGQEEAVPVRGVIANQLRQLDMKLLLKHSEQTASSFHLT